MDSETDRPGVRVTVFGGLRVRVNGAELDLGPARQRVLLAELVSAAGAVVSVSHLVEALWGFDDPPSSAVNQIHRMVGQLRRLLQPDLATREPGHFLHGAGSGYRLLLHEEECDLLEFRGAATSARAHAAAGRFVAAASGWAQALCLAVGEPFAGLDDAVLAWPEFVHLSRERSAAAAEGLEAGLACGQVGTVLVAAQRIAVGNSLDEALQARVVRALTAVGRRPEALAQAEHTRLQLAEELGIDPGPELAAALQEALAGVPVSVSPATTVPRQLPPPVRGFVERSGAKSVLRDVMGTDVDGTVAITAVGGMAGVGKTALALHWAHELAPQFPDGQLYVNLRGFDPGGRVVSAMDALGLLLQSMGVVLASVANDGLEARSARFRSLLAGQRVLVLLDNARDSEHVRPLLPSTAGCLVLVTSRNQLTGLVAREGARAVSLDRLSAVDSRNLLEARLGADRVSAEPTAVTSLVDACAGLPLALSMVAAKAALNPGRGLTDLAQEIAAGRLDALSSGEPNDGIRATFAASYAMVSQEAAQLFRLLAVHPGPEVSLAVCASLSGRSRGEVRGHFGELQAAGMVAEPLAGRFVVHDLLRLYAGERLSECGERDQAEHRLIEHYVRSTRNAYLTAGRPPLVPIDEGAPTVTPETFADMDQALGWYVRERPVLIAVLQLAIARAQHRDAAILVLDWRPMNQTLDAPGDTLPHALAALASADTVKDPLLQAELERDVAAKFARTGRTAEAGKHYEQALIAFRALGDLAGEAHTLRNLSSLALFQNDLAAARSLAEQSVFAARRSERLDAIPPCLIGYAEVLNAQFEHAEAVLVENEALELAARAGTIYLLPSIHASRAEDLYSSGRYAEAVEAAQAALASRAMLHNGESFVALTSMAAAALAIGNRLIARDAVAQAEQLLPTLEDRDVYGQLFTKIFVPRLLKVRAGLSETNEPLQS